jgi:outer membrane lipoprotein-sorting protein
MKIIWCLGFIGIFLVSSAFAQELSGEDIVKEVNALFNPSASYAKAKMTIMTTSGQERTFLYESWSKDSGEKNLIKYLEPRRVMGQAILMLNNADDIWAFFPRTQRVRKLATHAKKQKMQGSDFSYEDMGSGDAFIDDYDSQRLKDEKKEGFDCYKVELVRISGIEATYSRLMMWVIKENFYPVVIDYYAENDPEFLMKKLIQSDIQIIDGIPTAMRVVMKNETDNTETKVELLEVKYDIELDDDLFTERSLKK